MTLQERLDYLIKFTKGSLIVEVHFDSEAELEEAEEYLKGKRNTKSLVLKVASPSDDLVPETKPKKTRKKKA